MFSMLIYQIDIKEGERFGYKHRSSTWAHTAQWWTALLLNGLHETKHDIQEKKLLSPALRSQVQGLAARPQKWSPEIRSSPELTDCLGSVQFGSVTHLCLALCSPMDCSTPGLPVHHQLLEFTQTHVHRVGDATQPSHPLLSPSPAFKLSQHQGLFQWVSSSHEVARVLEFQLQHQSFQWIFRTDLL